MMWLLANAAARVSRGTLCAAAIALAWSGPVIATPLNV